MFRCKTRRKLRAKSGSVSPHPPPPFLGFSQHFQTHFEDDGFGEAHACHTRSSSAPPLLRELVGTPSFTEHVYSSYSGGMGSEGIDAALYALSTRAAWGRAGHPKEKNLQPHRESTRLPLISNFY